MLQSQLPGAAATVRPEWSNRAAVRQMWKRSKPPVLMGKRDKHEQGARYRPLSPWLHGSGTCEAAEGGDGLSTRR